MATPKVPELGAALLINRLLIRGNKQAARLERSRLTRLMSTGCSALASAWPSSCFDVAGDAPSLL